MTLSHLTFSTLASGNSIAKIAAGLFFIGIGMGFFGSPNSSSIFRSVPGEKSGYTGGFTATTRNFSISLGIAASASLFTYVMSRQQLFLNPDVAYMSAVGIVFKISAVITLCGLLISILTAKSRIPQQDKHLSV